MSRSKAIALLALALSVTMSASGCSWRLAKAEAQQVRASVVCAPQALTVCEVSRWFVPDPLSCDQAGELALVARAEAESCKEKHAALADCIKAHNEGSDK